MTSKSKLSGLALATAAAALFSTGAVISSGVAQAEEGKVHCGGLNSCKGESACATASSSCKGQNACKGQGWLPKASAEECEAAGGTVLES